MTEDRLHPVVRENMHVTRPAGRCWRMEARDKHGMNPTLIGYSEREPTQRRLAQFAGHYAHLIYAMPREVETTCFEVN